ncbi:MAG TPA: M23 family metallopeptidase [Myxococcota bacterium]|jgi:murein DD-endopeptidase MepM/ murein hydrolase activator NlpD
MERYSLIVMTDATKPVRRFDIARRTLVRSLQGAGLAALLLTFGLVDYVRVRMDHAELVRLRVETGEQRARIAAFDSTVAEVESRLARLAEFERKVRTIANLPGQAAAGGEDIEKVGGGEGGDLAEDMDGATSLDDEELTSEPATGDPVPRQRAGGAAAGAPGGDRVSLLRLEAERLGHVAAGQELTLGELIGQLEDKHHHLISSPAIWPTKGWLTSRFGPRISPFTGMRQFHSGIDIAGEAGTPVIAPARGRVIFVGDKGPLGRAIEIDHGYGVRTYYGHNREITVRVGQEVDRGEVIAKLGSSGRSTGPHLHYSVEVNGRSKNPLDFIFD